MVKEKGMANEKGWIGKELIMIKERMTWKGIDNKKGLMGNKQKIRKDWLGRN